jgi:hypothetical protein
VLDSVDEHGHLARDDDKEGGGARALLDHRLARGEAPLLEDARDSRELARVQLSEQGDPSEDIDGRSAHGL